jgi:colicin import membrane protein
LLYNREFKRSLAGSALAHLLLALIVMFGGWRPSRTDVLDVTYVDVLPSQAVPSPAPTKAAPPPPPAPPKPAPAEPAPPRQEVAELVIPRRPQPKPKPPAAKPPSAPRRPEPRPEPEPQAAPEPQQTASASQLLEQLRTEAAQRAGAATPEAQGTGARAGILDVERATYIKKVQAAVEPHWVSSACVRQPGAPLWLVEVEPSGRASDISLERSSGNRHCDDSTERALQKAQPLPPPPPGIRALQINFEELR